MRTHPPLPSSLRWAALALTLGLAVIGCRTPRSYFDAAGAEQPEESGVALHRLATRLGLTVTERGETYAALEDGRNTVLLFAGPSGRAYVNGRRVGREGETTRTASGFHVAERLESEIRAALGGGRTAPAIPPAPEIHRRVAIDAGHGGKDPGATSVLGTPEKLINEAVALEVVGLLREQGVQTVQIREGDVFVELEDRAERANRAHVDLFVSLHADAAGNPEARGFTLYVRRGSTDDSAAAARAIEKRLAATGLPSRGVREAGYRVLVKTTCPAVLVEMGFLSNVRDAGLLVNAAFRSILAEGIAAGIVDFLRVRR